MLEQEEQRDELLEKIEDLISRKRYAELRDLLLPLEAQDIAGLFMELDDKVPMVFRLLPKEQAAEVFVELDSEEQEVLIQSFSNTELKEVLDELYLDDAVDIVEEMPANVVKRILRHADPDVRKSINEILKYPDDCAGSIMTTEYVDLKATMTVEDALKRIRRTGPDKETINICYVIDEGRHLLGYLSIRTILLSEEDDVVGDIMDTHVISANTLDDQEDVAQTLNKYDFLALPIVDTENRLVGIVTDVGANYATVRSIIDDSSNVSAMSARTGENCIVTGDLMLFKEGRLSLSHIRKDADIQEGDKIVTSNISDIFLPGILIGYATDLTVDSNNMTKSGYILPVAEFDDLKEVLVITRVKETGDVEE